MTDNASGFVQSIGTMSGRMISSIAAPTTAFDHCPRTNGEQGLIVPHTAHRHQGYNHSHAKRVFRDSLPMFYKENLELSGGYIDDVDPEELLFIPQNTMTTEIRMAVLMRPEFDEEEIAKASPRETEYTIWCLSIPGFGVRIRPSGSKSYIVCFRVKHKRTQGRITLGKFAEISFLNARALALEVRSEALEGNDPRPMHKRGEFWRRIK